MLKDDINVSAIKKILNKDSRILNVSHNDMDGIGTNIVISNCANNVTHRKVSYPTIDDVIKKVNFDDYDCVIISDISPEGAVELLDISDKIVLLDHHPTAMKHHNPSKNRFVYEGKSATHLVKEFCELVFGYDISYLDDLVYLINDYDMWEHNDPRSKLMNVLYYTYWDDKFKRRFFEGVTEFTDEEKDRFKKREQDFNELYDALDVYDLDSIQGCLITCDEFVNDVCEKLLDEEGYQIVFARNSNSKNVSVRSRIVDCDLGGLLKEFEIGGGHPAAGGMHAPDLIKFQKNLTLVEKTLYKRFESVRS
jgi:oligoribonuclease NrnB/cAMP/cGMP phosphodiesterase (DHH superfamily)